MLRGVGEKIDFTNEGDAITAVEFDPTGDFLAAGDRNGRISILQTTPATAGKKKTGKWSPFFKFHSHDPEFDFLKSLEIEGKINQIKFCRRSADYPLLLSTNDKTIKLWKVAARKSYTPRAAQSVKAGGQLLLPRDDSSSPESTNPSLVAQQRKLYQNAHAYHINSLAMNSDMQTFVSADDLRINWWDMEISDTCFNVVDIKPDNMEELTEVITSVQFHPTHCNIMIYSSSRGAVKVCDTRSAALCNDYAKVYAEPPPKTGNKSFITDILNSISDVNYSQDGRYMVTRDYLSVKIWDVNMENRPVKTVALHDYLRPMLYDLYTSDIIFDKFEVTCSPDGSTLASGSYSNQLKLYHQDKRGLRTIDLPQTYDDALASVASAQQQEQDSGGTEVDEGTPQPGTPSQSKRKKSTDSAGSSILSGLSRLKVKDSSSSAGSAAGSSSGSSSNSAPAELKLDEKVLHCAWHPTGNSVAVAGKVGLCIYYI